MGHFSMEKSLNPGSVLGGNQQKGPMQKFGVAGIREIGASETAWRRLRRFHDVSLASARVMSARRLPEKQRKNVNKQMEQMSYCLTQAWEFVQSARASGLATKALQAYYAITALANAEVAMAGLEQLGSFGFRGMSACLVYAETLIAAGGTPATGPARRAHQCRFSAMRPSVCCSQVRASASSRNCRRISPSRRPSRRHRHRRRAIRGSRRPSQDNRRERSSRARRAS